MLTSHPNDAQPQRGRQSAFRAAADRLWAATRRKVSRLVYCNGGLGDELMLTAVAHAARLAGRPLDILTNLPEVWCDNKDACSVQEDVERWFYAKRRGWIQTEVVHLASSLGTGAHLAEQMAGAAGVQLPASWRPCVYNLPDMPPRQQRRILVQNSCRGARYASTTKEWPQGRWRELTAILARDYELVQLGTPADPPLPHVEDLRGRTSLRSAAAMLASGALFIGLESGLMHLAAAVRTPGVIIYGGRSRPHETGYDFNRNLTRSPACAGCGLNNGCPHDLICLNISVEEVVVAVNETLVVPAPPSP